MSVGEESFDVLCLSGPRGVLGVRAVDVRAVLEGDAGAGGAGDAGVERAPAFDLAGVLGAGAPGAPSRRIRVGSAEVAPFELLTSAALSIRRVARSALRPVPRWLAPFVEALGVRELLLEPEGLLLFAEPRRLASLCRRGTGGAAGAGTAGPAGDATGPLGREEPGVT